MATAISMESSQSLIQSESHVTRSYTETSSEHVQHRAVKKKKSTRRHKDEGAVSVSKSSEKLYKKMKSVEGETNPQCEKCCKPVYVMERIKAEKRVWHKECFRCVQCNKQLTVETYQSDHTTLYCKSHFKQLFEPKPVDGAEVQEAPPKKHQLIICESNPVELPPDVVRASDKPDLGLEELSQLDVKSRFEVFEKKKKTEEPLPMEAKVPREKSTALLSKLAKFKAKGMDIGVSDEYLSGVPVEASDSEPEDEDDPDSLLRQSYRATATRETPVALSNMSEIVGRFETGGDPAAERGRARKAEIQGIRSRLFMGKQAKIKEMYEQSVLLSEQGITSADKIARELDLESDKARSIKQKFETGEVFNDENVPPKNREIEDTALFHDGIGKQSRSIFLQLDANAKSAPVTTPALHDPPKRKEIPFVPKDVVRSADKQEDVQIQTADISDRFRFFETYQPETARKEFRMTPPRQTQRPKSPSPELYQEPTLSRDESLPDTSLAQQRHTASRMISVFREMEEREGREEGGGPKPLKCFTPPPPGAYTEDSSCEEEEDEEDDQDEDSDEERRRMVRQSRAQDDALQQAQQLARTTSFRSRFENWNDNVPHRSSVVVERDHDDEGESQLDTARSLREKFEAMKVQSSTVTKSVPKVNRFV